MKLSKANLILFSVFLISGCCAPRTDIKLTPFPPKGNIKDYTSEPVILFNKENKTYLITDELMHNTIINKIYIDEIHKWKTENGIK